MPKGAIRERRRLTPLHAAAGAAEVVSIATLRGRALPAAISSFVGRERELVQLAELLDVSRLVTITGPGGVGKTRLAVRLADAVRDEGATATRFVELAAVADPTLVSSSIAAAVGLQDRAATSPEALASVLDGRRLLLVADNCEHLQPAVGGELEALLAVCPGLSVLATSRTPLGLAGERLFALGPLAVPEPPGLATDVENLAGCDAVSLFSERARAAAPGFVLSAENAHAVATLCRRLDGLPLALELAASRIRGLGLDALLRQLERRPDVLHALGAATDRTHSVVASLDWSHDLLDDGARALWRRLSVLPGGATVETSRAVGAGGPVAANDVEELLAELVDHSILNRTERRSENRYQMLEVIRSYGEERARSAGEREATLDRARAHVLGWATRAAWWGPDQIGVLRRLDAEHANVVAILEDAAARPAAEADGLALAGHLGRWWTSRAHLSQGRHYLSRLLERPGEPSWERCNALDSAGVLAAYAGELDVAERLLRAAIELGDAAGVRGSTTRANLAMVRLAAGDLAGACAQIDAALARPGFPEEDREYVHCTEVRARVALASGEAALAGELLYEALECCEHAGEQWYRLRVLEGLGACALLASRLDAAAELFERSAASAYALGDWRAQATAAESLASVALERGDPAAAARLLGAAGELRQRPGPVPAWWAAQHERTAARARARLGVARFEALRAAGAELSVDEAWRSDPRALLRGAVRALERKPSPTPVELSRRELQVLRVLDAPVSLREVAAALYVSPNTLKSHCRSLYRKLDVPSRTAAVARARELGLID